MLYSLQKIIISKFVIYIVPPVKFVSRSTSILLLTSYSGEYHETSFLPSELNDSIRDI